MNCQVCQELLTEYALGSLASEEQAAVRGHLKGDVATGPCPECGQELATLHEALGMLPDTLDPVEPPAGLKREVLSRLHPPTEAAVANTVANTVVDREVRDIKVRSEKSRWQRAIPVLAALLCFVFAGLFGIEAYRQTEQPGANGAGVMEARMAQAERRFGALTLQPVSLSPLAGVSQWSGQAYVDAPAGQLHLYAFNTGGKQAGPVVWLQSSDGNYVRLQAMEETPQLLTNESVSEVWTAVVDLPTDPVGKLIVSLDHSADATNAAATEENGPGGSLLLSADLKLFRKK